MIAAAALATAFVYLFTPLTAAGQEGSPTGLLHQHPLPDAGAGPGDGAAADRAAAAGARPARLADAALLDRGLRDHGADDAALVPGLHRRHDLPHPGAGLGAGRAGRWARARGAGQPRAWSPRAAACVLLLAVVLGRAQEVQYADHHYTKSTPSSAKAGRRKPTTSPAASTTSGSGSPAPARSSSASTASTAADLDNYVQYIGVPGPHGTYRLATTCHAVPPPDQRRRLRLPDHQPVHRRTRRDGRILVPDLRLGKNDPALKLIIAEPDIMPAARLRLQGQRQARPGRLRRPRQAGCERFRRAASACSRTSSAERSGCSHQNMWPTSSRARGGRRGSARRSAGRWRRRARGRRCRG